MKKILLLLCGVLFTLFIFGQEVEWVTQLDQLSSDSFQDKVRVHDVAADGDGNVYVTGTFRGICDFNPSAAGGELTSYYGSWYSEDPYIAKYDADGNYLWAQHIIGLQGLGAGNSLAVDKDGNVYVAGKQYVTDLALFLTKYSPSGTQEYYYAMEGYETSVQANIITLDGSGNLYFFSRFEEPFGGGVVDLDPTAGVDNHNAVGDYDAYIAKFTASTGAYQWGISFGGTGYEEPYDIETDGTYVYVCGGFPNTVDFNPGAGVNNLTSNGNTDIFVARYLCSTGAYNYAYSFGGTSYDRGYNIALEDTYLYFALQYTGTIDFDPTGATYNLTSASGGTVSSYPLLRMNKSTLAVDWGYNTPFGNGVPALETFKNGVLMSRTIPTGTFDFDPGAGTSNLTSNGWTGGVLFLDENQNFQWAVRAAEPATSSYYKALCVDKDDTGFFFGTDFATSADVDPDGNTISLTEGSYGDDAFISHWITCEPSVAPTSAIVSPTSVCPSTPTNLTLTASGGSLGTGAVVEWYKDGCGNTSVGTGNPLVVSQTLSSSTTYYARYEGDCGTTTCASTTVSVYTESTAPTSISGTTTICPGDNTTLTAVGGTSGTGATYQWYAGGCGSGAVLGTGVSLVVSPASTTTYYVRRTGTCNTTSCASVTVTVNTESTAPTSISGTTTICPGDNTTLTAVGGTNGTGATYQWYAGGCGSGAVLGTGVSLLVSPASTTTYYVRRTGTCNTTSCASVTVTVNSESTAPTSISGTTTICPGDNTTLTAVGGTSGTGATYQWYAGGCGSGAVLGTGVSLVVSPASTTTYYVRRTGTCNTTSCASVTVTVNTESTAPTSISGTTTICPGDNTTLTAVGGTNGTGATYQWYEGGCGSGAVLGTGVSLLVSPASTTTYYVRRTGTCNTTSCVSVTVTVNTESTAPTSISGTTTICNGDNTTLTAVGGTDGTGASYQWYEGGCGSGSVLGTGVSLLVSPTSTTTYYVRRTGTCNTTSCANVTVTVDQLPTASAGGSQTICVNGTATVSGASASNGTISWTEDGAGSITSGATTLTPTYTPAVGDAGGLVTLTMTVTSDNSCISETAQATYTVNVDPLPTASTPVSQSACIGYTTEILGASSSNGSILWTGGPINSGATTISPDITLPAGTTPASYEYVLTVTSDNACSPQIAQSTITVDFIAPAEAHISGSGSQTICINETATVSGASAVGSILWTENGAGTITSGATTLTPTYTPAAGDEGNTVMLLMTVTSDIVCSPLNTAHDTYYVYVDPLPTASAGGSETICVNETATVSGASASNGTISWTEDGAGSITSGATTLTPVYTPAAGDEGNTVTLTMTVTSDNACNPQTAQATYNVDIDPLPTASAGGSTSICSTETATVSGASASNGTILWTEDGAGSITSGATTLTPIYTPDAADEGNTVTLTMTVTSDNSCTGETAQAIYTVDVLSAPTAPTAGFPSSNNFCEDDPGNIDLIVSGGGSGTVHWFDDACGGNEIGTGNPLTIASPTATTTYYARYESTCGISPCYNFDVTVVEPPVAPIKAESDINDICADHSGNVELYVTGGSGDEVQWFTGSCGGTSIGTGNPLVLPSPDVTTTYYARWANTCGESSCVQHTVTVIQLPTDPTSASSDMTDFCSDDANNMSLELVGGTGDDVYWYTESCGGTSVGTGTPLSIETPTTTTTYYGRWENSCGESSCEQVTVNVIDLPEAPSSIIPSANDICSNDAGTIDLGAVGGTGTTLHWYTGSCGGTEIGTGNPLTIDSPESTTEYFAAWENSCGTSTCASVLINVIDAPTDPTEAQVDISEVCFDDAGNIELTLIGGAGPTVEWYSGSCGGTPVGTGNPLIIESPTVTTTYYGRYESSCGNSACASVEVTVNPIPVAPTEAIVDRTDFCADDAGDIELSVTGGSGDELIWYTESCGGTQVGIGNPLIIESPTSTTTYYALWSNDCGVSTCQNITVTVIDEATAPTSIIPSDNNVCVDDPGTIDLGAVGGTGTTLHWYTGSCGGTEIGTGNPLTIDSPTVTTEYFAAWENSCGISTCSSVTINVIDAPTDPTEAQVDINEVCVDDAGNIELTLVGGAGPTVEWYSGSCGGTPVGTGSPLTIESPTVTTTYYGRYESSCGNSACASVEVTVNPIPVAPTEAIVDRTDFCADDAGDIELSVTGGSGDELIWYTESCGGTQIGIGNPLVIDSPTETTTYYASWSNGCGVSTCASIVVSVIEAPTAPSSITPSSNNVCVDDPGTIDLAAVGGTGTTLHWYTESCGGTDIGSDNPLVIDSPTEDTEYFVAWENSCGISSCTSVLINVIDEPTDPTGAQSNVTEVCFDDDGDITLTLIGGEGPTVEWYSGSCGGTPVGTGNPLTIESPTVTTMYYGRYESSCGNSACVSVEVKVNQIPEPPVSAEVDVNDLCSNDDGQISLSVTGGDGQDVYWYTESCGTTLVGNGNPLVIDSPDETTTYYGRWENACGASVCQNVTVNIIQGADATINPTGPFCITSSPTVVTAAETGGTWSGDGINETTGLFEPSVAGVGDHIITYTITGTCGDTDEITITVLDIFDATIDDVDDICENASPITLTAATEGGVWSGDGIIDTDNGIFDPSVAGAGSHTITYEYTGTCGGFDDVVIIVNAAADATISPVGPFCEDADPVVVTAAESGGTWNGTAIDPTTGFFDPEVAGIGDHVITYTIDGDCGDTDQITISVLEYFDATITSGIDLCYRDSLALLTAVSDGGTWEGADIVSIEDETYLYLTDIGAGTYEIIYHYDGLCGDADTVTVTVYPDVDPTITAVDTLTDEDDPVQLVAAQGGGIWGGIFVDELGVFDPVEAGIASHQVIYTIEGPCGDADTVNIIVIDAPIDDLLIPTVITPDNDGYNDRWRIQGIEAYNQISIKIFTRWGDEVFVYEGSGLNYTMPINQWDGKRKSKDLPTGSYVYILILENQDTYKGTISLIR